MVNDPKLVKTKTGTHKMELDCHNDDEEGVRVLAWRQDADELCEQLRKGDVSLFCCTLMVFSVALLFPVNLTISDY